MNTSQAYACFQDKQSDGTAQQLGQYQLLEGYIDIHNTRQSWWFICI